ncbi:hypothetical protein [Agromyces mariniharenae]|uniref:Uncharacterized protein n=1 Tax=Agromyces mariniharenae TaxID=2604423 RepID=A0A5S4V0E8_9MICO|nr:hypothetical protein [Agromyces mariniharenae]TYL52372.1 hypothetical protein FYC51_00950 [Agromyces mariniharenae]
MSGDGTQFEYPDEAGYPDGMGTLHEGTDEASGEAAGEAAEADTAEDELDEFAMQDEEDVDGNV